MDPFSYVRSNAGLSQFPRELLADSAAEAENENANDNQELAAPADSPDALSQLESVVLSFNALSLGAPAPAGASAPAAADALPAPLPSFARLPALRRLDLSHNALAALPRGLARAAPALESLNVAHNRLADLRALEGCAALQQLWAHHNGLSALEATARALEALPSLRALALQCNPCVARGLEAQDALFSAAAAAAAGARGRHQLLLQQQLQQQLQDGGAHAHAGAGAHAGASAHAPSAAAAAAAAAASPAAQLQADFERRFRGLQPLELFLARSCADLRALVLRQPQAPAAGAAGAAAAVGPMLGPGGAGGAAAPGGPAPFDGGGAGRAAAVTGEIAISDGGAISALRLLQQPRALLRLGPDHFDAARTWRAERGPTGGAAFLRALEAAERAHAAREAAAAAHAAASAAAAAAAAAGGAEAQSPLATGRGRGGRAVSGGGVLRPRVPLAEVRAKVPSRYAQRPAARPRAFDEEDEASEVGGAGSVGGRTATGTRARGDENAGADGDGEKAAGAGDGEDGTAGAASEAGAEGGSAGDEAAVAATPVRAPRAEGEGGDAGAAGESGAVDGAGEASAAPADAGAASPTAGAVSMLQEMRARMAGLLSAVSGLPDAAQLAALGPARGARPLLPGAAAGQQMARGGRQAGKRKQDPEVARLLRSAGAAPAAPDAPAGALEDGADAAAAPPAAGPRVFTSLELFRVAEGGALVGIDSDGGLLVAPDGEVRPLAAAGEAPFAARLRADGTLLVRWPNGSTALEVVVDERASLALAKWRAAAAGGGDGAGADAGADAAAPGGAVGAVGAGGRAAAALNQSKRRAAAAPAPALAPGDTRCLSISAYAREAAGRARTLAVSLDATGSGTVCGGAAGTAATLALLQEGGGGFHGDGTGGGRGAAGASSSAMQRQWDAAGRLTVVGAGYADVPPPQQPAPEPPAPAAAAAAPAPAAADAPSAPVAPDAAAAAAAGPPDASIANARAVMAAALASAEATNAAVAAILRTRALLERQGMAAPRREDHGADPRKARGGDEAVVRRALLRLVSPALWGGEAAPGAEDDWATVPKAARTAAVLGGPRAVGFVLGQHLGAVLCFEDGGGERVFWVVCAFGAVRLAVRMALKRQALVAPQ